MDLHLVFFLQALWNREGLLRPGQSYGWAWIRNGKEEASIGVTTLPDAVELSYTLRPGTDGEERVRYSVPITWTECNYGGRRPWFVCPKCSRRVGKLYLYSVSISCAGIVGVQSMKASGRTEPIG